MQKARRRSQPTTPTRVVQEMQQRATRPAWESHSRDLYGGNQATLRRLSRGNHHLQYKLEVGPANDPLETEADRVADHVMRMPDPAVASSGAAQSLRRKCAACEDEDMKKVQTKSDGHAQEGGEAPPIVHQVLGSSGQPLDSATRAFFEPRFGAGLEGIRVHSDEAAGRSAQAVGAVAYAAGGDIVFAPGQYQPHSTEGKRLLAHELAHTVQQGAAAAPNMVGRMASASTRGISRAIRFLQRSPECPYKYGKCGGQSCTHSTGGAGFCRWSGAIETGCVCIKIENTVLVRWIETVLLAALVAIGVVIALEALIALVACFASGACEVAALIAALGFAGAMLVIAMLKSAPSGTSGPPMAADEGGTESPAAPAGPASPDMGGSPPASQPA